MSETTGTGYVIDVHRTITRQTCTDILDTALAAGWGWWGECDRAPVAGVVYSIEVMDEHGNVDERRVFSQASIAHAIERIIADEVQLRPDLRRQVETAITDDPDLDADAADCVVQVAVFGKVVFG